MVWASRMTQLMWVLSPGDVFPVVLSRTEQIFFCNGRKMSVKGTINPGDGAKIQHVEYTIGWRDVCVSTEVGSYRRCLE